MKSISFLSLLYLISWQGKAITIQQIEISCLSDEMVNISLNTAAEELYYFGSWNYELSGNEMVVKACFMRGFGSTIAFLNNNFEIAINTTQTQMYYFTVEVYFDNFEGRNLQDTHSGFFSTPIINPILLLSNHNEITEEKVIKFVNPTNGELSINKTIHEIYVFDESYKFVGFFKRNSNIIDISNLSNGLFLLVYFYNGSYRTSRVVLLKK